MLPFDIGIQKYLILGGEGGGSAGGAGDRIEDRHSPKDRVANK